MPDLVIKPTAGAGNKLILQDQGGGTGAIIENATITVPVLKLTPGSAPSSPVEGELYYDSTTKRSYIYNGSNWQSMADFSRATGGIISSYTDGGSTYVVHKFLTSGSFTPLYAFSIDYLLVAGGGGAGNCMGGGAGAGGLIFLQNQTINPSLYSIVIGAGAPYATVDTGADSEQKGENSTAFGSTAIGGGHAGTYDGHTPGVGGSGGGGGGKEGSYDAGIQDGAAGTANQGYAGGNGTNRDNGGYAGQGGGGGAGGVGGNGTFGGNAGAGGVGVDMSSYFGISVGDSGWFAGGGGGAPYSTHSGGAGGKGGGGDGGTQTAGEAGQANTGGGGGGGSQWGHVGGAGGSGIVIIRYAI